MVQVIRVGVTNLCCCYTSCYHCYASAASASHSVLLLLLLHLLLLLLLLCLCCYCLSLCTAAAAPATATAVPLLLLLLCLCCCCCIVSCSQLADTTVCSCRIYGLITASLLLPSCSCCCFGSLTLRCGFTSCGSINKVIEQHLLCIDRSLVLMVVSMHCQYLPIHCPGIDRYLLYTDPYPIH